MEVRDGPIDSRIRERPRVVRQSRIPMCQEHGTHAAHSSQHRSPALPHAAVRTRSAIPAARGGLLALTNCSPGSARPADASCRGSRSRACEAEVEGDGLPSSRGREACASPHHAWDRCPAAGSVDRRAHAPAAGTHTSVHAARTGSGANASCPGWSARPPRPGGCMSLDGCAPASSGGAPEEIKTSNTSPRQRSGSPRG